MASSDYHQERGLLPREAQRLLPDLWRQFEGQIVEQKYHLRKLLGAGGFGGVFQADHIVRARLIRRVAVKLIAPDPNDVDQQLEELVGATNLHHPNLLPAYDAGQTLLRDMNLLYLVMELAEENLGQVLVTRLLPAEQALPLARQLVSALRYLHGSGLVHRDIKPANLLRVGAAWKLSDFGLLRWTQGAHSVHTRNLTGSTAYIPPEAYTGVVSPAWDIWSFAVTLGEALTGQRPSPMDPEATQRAAPPRHKNLPPPFDAILPACLQRDRAARPTADQLEQWFNPSTAPVTPVPERHATAAPSTAAGRPARRLWPWAALGVAAVAVSVLLSGVLREPARRSATPSPAAVPESRPAPTSGRPRASVPAPTSSAPVEELPADEAAEREAVQRLLDAWVDSTRNLDLETQVDCYAPVVNIFFRKRNVTIDEVRRDKEAAFSKVREVREYSIAKLNIEALTASRAVLTFDKKWDLVGQGRHSGSERQRLTLRKIQGEWKIASEEELEIYQSTKE